MHTSPSGLAVGDKVTQVDIEDAFQTGFGYRISGINPRRDDQDQRYVLLFANEDGPYSDSVTQGTFEYVGEGLEGDQKESSPGNSVLIDAVTGGFPVYFFYQRGGDGRWEYQGQVDVLDYEYRERDGRQVLVFTVQHQSNRLTGLADEELGWVDAMRLELQRYRERRDTQYVTLPELYDASERWFSLQFPDNDNVRAKMRQTLQRLRDAGDVEFLEDPGSYRIDVGDDLPRAKSELRDTLTEHPTLMSETESFTQIRRRVRDRAFTEIVREAYDDTCAICSSSRETPAGNPEVEAAHIYPKREGGADDVRNALALCKLHHWAFDSGWFSVSDEYRILVADAPASGGYFEFKQLEGERLTLPDDDSAHPHPMFLQKHREIHEF